MKPSLVMLFAGAVMCTLGCSDNVSVAAGSAAVTSPPVTTVEAPVPSDASFVASGPITVEHQVEVMAQRDGVIEQIEADAGARVRAGDILGKLDDRQLAADLDAARAKTRSTEADLKNWQAESNVLEADFARAQKMWDAQLITKEQLDHARYKAESDQWDVQRVSELLVNARDTERSLELELEKTRIRAPFSGVIARRYVRAGQQVAKGDRLFWVTETSPLRVSFSLPEKYVGKLRKGDALRVYAAGNSDSAHEARVTRISPVVDPSSGSIDVIAQIIGSAPDLLPGMSVNIRPVPGK
jgi:RND family efflux transporter MFP subunit